MLRSAPIQEVQEFAMPLRQLGPYYITVMHRAGWSHA